MLAFLCTPLLNKINQTRVSMNNNPLPCDQHITGYQFLNAKDQKYFYAKKPINMDCGTFLKTNPDFHAKTRLETFIETKDCELVKLMVNKDSSMFVECCLTIGDVKNVDCEIVTFMKDTNNDN